MWKEVEHVILAPEKVIDEIVDVFYIFHVSIFCKVPELFFHIFLYPIFIGHYSYFHTSH